MLESIDSFSFTVPELCLFVCLCVYFRSFASLFFSETDAPTAPVLPAFRFDGWGGLGGLNHRT